MNPYKDIIWINQWRSPSNSEVSRIRSNLHHEQSPFQIIIEKSNRNYHNLRTFIVRMTPSNEQSYKRKLRVLREVRFRDCVVSVWTEFIIGTYRPAHTHKSQIRNSNNRLTLATLLPNRTVETFLCCTHTHTQNNFTGFIRFKRQYVPMMY